MRRAALVLLCAGAAAQARLSGYVDAVQNATLLGEVKNQTYDYIIVGGGNTGLAVAGRLSDNGGKTVLVIEAGPSARENPGVVIPGLSGSTFLTDVDWAFNTVPQVNAHNRSVYTPRGRMLGGSSGLNFLAWTRGDRADYDAIATLAGSSDWTWSALLPFFKRSERFTAPKPGDNTLGVTAEYDPSVHGFDGPIDVANPPYLSEQIGGFMNGLSELGAPVDKDLSDGEGEGRSWSASSMKPKTFERVTSDTGYIAPIIARRPNLLVLSSAHVAEIVWGNGKNKGNLVASGVTFLAGGDKSKASTVTANKEVILSAGSVQTPQLLELSGVGSPSVLQPLGIKTQIDLPGVGENLQDHPGVVMVQKLKPGYVSLDGLAGDRLNAALADFSAGKGILTQELSALAYLRPSSYMSLADVFKASLLALTPTKYLPIKQHLQSIAQLAAGSPVTEFVAINTYFGATAGEANVSYISLAACLQHSFSRGSIHITNTDPTAAPAIDPAYLQHKHDLFHMVKSVQFLRKLVKTKAFAPYLAEEAEPGPGVSDSETDIEEWVRGAVRTEYHLIGTASMMPRSDGGVVDTKLKVYGTHNIRVADLSVPPIHIATHTQSVAYAIGEKAAAMILQG